MENQTKLAFYAAIEKYLARENITSIEIEILARAYTSLEDRSDKFESMSRSLIEAIKLNSPVQPPLKGQENLYDE